MSPARLPRIVVGAVLWTMLSAARAADPAAAFEAARQAYTATNFTAAAEGFAGLAAAGYAAPEVLFNAGNAAYRTGRLGEAVLHYRRAWRQTPRDPDVLANLAFVLSRAGAPAPESAGFAGRLRRVSLKEWRVTAAAAYGLLLALGAAALFRPGWRRTLRASAWIAGAALALAAAGWGSWAALDRTPEAVMLATTRQARFGPRDDLAPHYAVPAGAIVRVEATREGWARIRLDGKIGWVRGEDLARVAP